MRSGSQRATRLAEGTNGNSVNAGASRPVAGSSSPCPWWGVAHAWGGQQRSGRQELEAAGRGEIVFLQDTLPRPLLSRLPKTDPPAFLPHTRLGSREEKEPLLVRVCSSSQGFQRRLQPAATDSLPDGRRRSVPRFPQLTPQGLRSRSLAGPSERPAELYPLAVGLATARPRPP